MELAGARGQGARRHENTMDSVEENARNVGKLTGVTKTAKTARNGPSACGGSRRALRGRAGERVANERSRTAWLGCSPTEAEARGRSRTWERGEARLSAGQLLPREREEREAGAVGRRES